ncbi:L7Ae/L30e/S12e/Gadd45 family ribosomal protein [Massiliimalia massiliensis]|jgi:ribosomal protein L7Ae-like RNA K-turn-binding protein|uniref:L7Ae/L30e/S12e/Gadd45 family ribosomal protein n=1 Tax=Massiliimalia massiliensis TaxID=1852384 RepID=UPI0009853A10|nr:ribosomal L7Ae/L30e/S12e/Gadd45 family protein [Massiliimalia massiliensis]
MNKLIETVTFCKRIGGLVIGFDLVKQAMQKGEAGLVLLARDLSPKTEKEIRFLCGQFDVALKKTELSLDEFWYLIGKRAGVIAVTNPAFAEKLLTVIDEANHMENEKEDAEYGD